MNPRSESGVPWLGSVPSHWSVLEPRRIFGLRKQVEQPGDVHLTPSQHYGVIPQEEYMEVTGAKVVLNLSGTSMQHVEPSDFISHLRTFQGGLELARAPGKVSPAYTVVSPRPGVDPEYFKYVFKSQGYVSQIASVTDQLRDGQTMRYTEFNRTPLPLPPVGEQRAIADYLDHETAEIDAFIAEHFALIELAQERRLSTIDACLDSSGSWQTPLKYLGQLRTGIALGTRYDQETQEYPYLRVANVQTDQVDLTDIATVNVPKHIADCNRLLTGDVLMTEGGDRDKLGRGALWQAEIDNMLHQNHVFAFRCNSDLLPSYLVYVLESSPARFYFDVTAKQSTNLASTNSTTVKRLRIPQPGVQDQQSVIQLLDKECSALDEAISDAQRTIDLSRERREALISAAVTGQIDVTKRHKPVAEVLEDEVREMV